MPVRERLPKRLPVAGKGDARFEDAFRMLCMAVQNVALLGMSRTQRSGCIGQIGEPARKGGKKQGDNEQNARNLAG